MVLQPCSLIRHDRIRRCMGSVEPVFCEIHQLVKNLPCQHYVNPVRLAAADSLRLVPVQERLAFNCEFLGLLLAHGTAYHVRPAKGISCEFLENLHDLFLVYGIAICMCQDWL